MKLVAKHLTIVFGAFLAFHSASAQEGEPYGGPDEADAFDLLSEETDASEAAAFEMIWDVNDSLFHIPGYDMYCRWNTEKIFDRSLPIPPIHDTLRLYLSQDDCDHAMPCAGHVTSPFGPRRGRMHYGVDLKLQTGDPVVSAFSGMVRISRYNKSFGHVVVVRHYNGLETLYAHLSKRLVQPGDLIEAGDNLGLGGNTGRSYGSHLHFEVRFLDEPIDPSEVFDLSAGELKVRTFDIHKGTFEAIAKARAELTARKFHVVRSGDTLSSIARRYGTSVGSLCRMNGISQSSILRIGQRVRYN